MYGQCSGYFSFHCLQYYLKFAPLGFFTKFYLISVYTYQSFLVSKLFISLWTCLSYVGTFGALGKMKQKDGCLYKLSIT